MLGRTRRSGSLAGGAAAAEAAVIVVVVLVMLVLVLVLVGVELTTYRLPRTTYHLPPTTYHLPRTATSLTAHVITQAACGARLMLSYSCYHTGYHTDNMSICVDS